MADKNYIGDGSDLGVDYGEAEYVFPYFGEEIRVHPEAGELVLVDFMEKGAELDSEDEAKALPVVMEFLRNQIHPDDWDTFFRLAKRKRQKMADLMNVAKAITETLSGFPTGQPADSPPTRQRTGRKSRAGSSSRVTPLRSSGESNTTKALTILQGRPDLQSAVMRAQEGRSAG